MHLPSLHSFVIPFYRTDARFVNVAFVTIDSAMLLYTYISRFPVNPHYQQQFYLRPSFIAFFNFSHKRPTFAFTSESGYTLGFRRRIAYKGLHVETGVFPSLATVWLCAASEIATERTAGESGCTPHGVCPLPPASRPRWAA